METGRSFISEYVDPTTGLPLAEETSLRSLVSPILGLCVAILGLSASLGWLLHVPMLFEIRHGLVPMVFNTGLCFLLAGTALFLPALGLENPIQVRSYLGTLLIGICSLTLLELLLDRSVLGIDLVALHSWYDYGNTRPGRMAPNTAIGFIVVGCAILVGDRVRGRGQGLLEIGLTFLLLIIGITGLIGYLLAPELLFNWARSARMALQTASGMILLALSLWWSWSRSAWYVDETYFREDGKVRLLSGAILVIVTTTASLTSFVLLQEAERTALADKLTGIVRARGPWLQLLAKEMLPQAERAAVFATFSSKELALLNAGSAVDISRKEFASLADSFAKQGWRRVVIQGSSNTTISLLGPAQTQPEFVAQLDDTGTAELLWDRILLLRFNQPLKIAGSKEQLRLVMEREVPLLAATLFSTQGLGASGEIAACISREAKLVCLPTRTQPKPFVLTPRPPGAEPLPMQLALGGLHGVVEGLDYRQQSVVASYGLLAPGLGFVAKQDSTEVYAPIRHALTIGALLTALVSVVGAVVMVWQLSPLVARMRLAEAVASDVAKKMQNLAQFDHLTGLPNRALFMDRITTATVRAARLKEAMAVMFIDVDGFKGINDTFGHDAGDAILVETGRRLASAVRKSDTVARMGGDEFTVILEGLTNPGGDVQTVIDNFVQTMRKPFMLQEQARQITLSIGVAFHAVDAQGVDPDTLLKLADEAMYEAKRAGKNGYRVIALSDALPTA